MKKVSAFILFCSIYFPIVAQEHDSKFKNLASIIIPDQSLASDYITTQGNSTLDNTTFYLEGEFYVDVDFTINNSIGYMAPAAQIVVMSGYTFTLDQGSQLMSCSQMWQGIRAREGSAVNVLGECVVRDAEYGVYLEDETQVSTNNCSFINCLYGIYSEADIDCGYQNIALDISDSDFLMDQNQLKDAYLNQALHGQKTRAGLYLHDVLLSLGGGNYFKNLHCGIQGIRSHIEMNEVTMDSIISDLSYHDDWGGSAIVSRGRSDTCSVSAYLNIFAQSPGVNISHSQRGVYNEFGDLYVYNANFNNMLRDGILSKNNSMQQKMIVYNNDISLLGRGTGIHFINNAGASTMNIGSNSIETQQIYAQGIVCEELLLQVQALEISGNSVLLNPGQNGILLRNVQEAQCTYNNIEMQQGSAALTRNGIISEGCDSTLISCNQVLGYNSNDTLLRGITIDISNNTHLQCNSVDQTGIGMRFGGNCAGTNMRGNTMQNNWEGLRINNVGLIGVQEQHGNQWINVQGPFGANNLNITIQGLQNSQFEVNTSPGTTLHPIVPPYNISVGNGGTAPVNWYDLDPLGIPFSCGSSQICNTAIAGGGDNDLKRMIAEGNIETVDYKPESKNMAEQYLFEALIRDDSLLNSDTVYTSFYAANENAAIGKLYTVKEKFTPDASTAYLRNTLAAADSLIRLKTDSLFMIDSINAVNPLSNYVAQREAIVLALNVMNQTAINISSQIKAIEGAREDTAIIVNTTVAPVEFPEQNEKAANEIIYMHKKLGTDTLVQYLNNIRAIAQQCPFRGGKAVYQMRAMLEYMNDTLEYDDDAACLQQGIYRNNTSASQSIDSEYFRIRPNPTSGNLEIDIVPSDDSKCSIFIISSVFQIIRSFEINCKVPAHSLSLEDLAPGIYAVAYLKEDKLFNHRKLVIVK
ncbi:MAG TPA: hypothetical protein PKM16_10080 [Bacteroidia bacterium]|nr:hypothetical protein [Bacteroidia bacterium]